MVSMSRFKEHQSVVLLRDLAASEVCERGIGKMAVRKGTPVVLKGTHGFIVDLPTRNDMLVELMDEAGETIGLADLHATDLRPSVPSDFLSRVASE